MSKHKGGKRFFSSLTNVVFPKFGLNKYEQDPNQYIGKTIIAQREFDQPFEEIKIKDVKGNIANPKHFQVNGTHFISMFSFYAQMIDGKLPTKEEEDEFNLATDIKDIRRIDETNDKKGNS